MDARIAPPFMEATDASRLVCVVVVSYQEYSLTHTHGQLIPGPAEILFRGTKTDRWCSLALEAPQGSISGEFFGNKKCGFGHWGGGSKPVPHWNSDIMKPRGLDRALPNGLQLPVLGKCSNLEPHIIPLFAG